MATAASAQPVTSGAGTSVRCADGTFPITAPVSEVFGGAANNEIVALTASKEIRLYRWILQSTADVQLKFVQGTGTDCATSEIAVTNRIDPFSTVNRPVDSEHLVTPIIAPAGKALCLDASGAATITGYISYCVD
jgi:hypothetical protein